MISDEENKSTIRQKLDEIFKFKDYYLVDAMSIRHTTDNYCKICELILSCAFGVALITEKTEEETLRNIYLEIGLMKAFGKEVLILTDNRCKIATDLVGKGSQRYSNYDELQQKVHEWLNILIKEQAHVRRMAEIWIKEKDYEKAFEYYRKGVMLGDFEHSFRILKEKLDPKNKKLNISKRLKSQISQFIDDIDKHQSLKISVTRIPKRRSIRSTRPQEINVSKSDIPSISLKLSDLPTGWISETKTVVGDLWEYGSSFRDTPKRVGYPTLKSVIYNYSSIEEAKKGFANAKKKIEIAAREGRLFIPDIGDECYGYISDFLIAVVVFRRGNLLIRTEYKCDPTDPTTEDAEYYARIVDNKVMNLQK